MTKTTIFIKNMLEEGGHSLKNLFVTSLISISVSMASRPCIFFFRDVTGSMRKLRKSSFSFAAVNTFEKHEAADQPKSKSVQILDQKPCGRLLHTQ